MHESPHRIPTGTGQEAQPESELQYNKERMKLIDDLAYLIVRRHQRQQRLASKTTDPSTLGGAEDE